VEISGGALSAVKIVAHRRDGPHWLSDHDDDDDHDDDEGNRQCRQLKKLEAIQRWSAIFRV